MDMTVPFETPLNISFSKILPLNPAHEVLLVVLSTGHMQPVQLTQILIQERWHSQATSSVFCQIDVKVQAFQAVESGDFFSSF